MQRLLRNVLACAAIAGLAFAAGALAGKKNPVTSAMYEGQEPKAAAAALLDMARRQAESGSWENLAVGRVLYLSGDKAGGQEIFDRVLADKKVGAGDVVRVARVYAEAGEWDKARPMFDRVVEMKGDDEDWLAEVGAHYLLHGDRAKAEELFSRSIAQDPESLYNTLRIAGAYLGLAPQN